MKTLLLLFTIKVSSITLSQVVTIPDAQFKAYLVGNSSINTNMDSEIQVSEASSFSGILECDGWNISDLTGIESFTSLIFLRCHNNNLTTLDLSSNTLLTDLNCSLNSLTTLDLSSNTVLKQLTCSYNDLTNLDLSNCGELLYINCRDNELINLDLFGKTDLMNVTCRNNNITSLDASSNSSLQVMICDNNDLSFLDVSNGYNLAMAGQNFDASNNPNLTCIQVDDPNYSNTNWSFSIDAQSFFNADCSTANIDQQAVDKKEIIMITDILGRSTERTTNEILIYLYNDGTLEKVFRVE